MKDCKLIIMILLLGLINKSYALSQVITDKVLILEYYEEVVNLKVIKDYKEKDKRYKYLTVQPIENPTFDKKNRRLDVNGYFHINDSLKVVFLGGGYANGISLPFKYAKVKLNRIINDTIVEFQLVNKGGALLPYQLATDSIVENIHEGERIIQRTIRYSLKNYGLIMKCNLVDNGLRREKEIDGMLEEDRVKDSIKNITK